MSSVDYRSVSMHRCKREEVSSRNCRSTIPDFALVLRELTTLLTIVTLLMLDTAQLRAPGHKINGSVNMLVNSAWVASVIPCS